MQTEQMKGIEELDLTGFADTGNDGVWQNEDGVCLRVVFQDSPPALEHWVETRKNS